MDKNNDIKKSNDQAKDQLEEIVKETSESSKELGQWLKSLIDFVKKFSPR